MLYQSYPLYSGEVRGNAIKLSIFSSLPFQGGVRGTAIKLRADTSVCPYQMPRL